MYKATLLFFAVLLAVGLQEAHGYEKRLVVCCVGDDRSTDIVECSKLLYKNGQDKKFEDCILKLGYGQNPINSILSCVKSKGC